jgi:hypothetical protein
MPDDTPSAPIPVQRSPRFTIASWVVLLVGLLLTFGASQWAYVHRSPGEWLPGIAELLIGWAATAVGCFVCGLVALLRKERRRAFALIPFLGGLGTILYFAWNFFSKR